ncbi:MAG TPA: MoxR family ATPase [Opitutaceae bacterium]|nr:MoxR family ATPase [Opitutaceae bacterium]
MNPGQAWTHKLRSEIGKAVIGQDKVVERLLVALLANGHVLLEGMPGLAKTLLVRSLGRALGVQFERIQFTPDLLPSDVVGTMIFQPRDGQFTVHKGPVFANLVLADEINRAPAKVQSALLEAMQERQVTIGGSSLKLPAPFFVMATQNPIEQEGTYPLPEAQTDRFLFKLLVDYPDAAEERTMLDRWGAVTAQPELQPVSTGEELLGLRKQVDAIHAAPAVQGYILALVRQTRVLAGTLAPTQNGEGRMQNAGSPPALPQLETQNSKLETAAAARRLLSFGASPRASLALLQSARALAWMRGQEFVTPALVQELAPDILRHRIGLTYEAEAEELTPDAIIRDLLKSVPVPAA